MNKGHHNNQKNLQQQRGGKNKQNKKIKKGQNANVQEAAQPPPSQPLLTFGEEESKAMPPQARQTKKDKRDAAILTVRKKNSIATCPKGNCQKDDRNRYESKNYLGDYADDLGINSQSAVCNGEEDEECEILMLQHVTEECLESLYYDNLIVLQHATEDSPGVFQVRIWPSMAIETAGCHVALKLSYVNTESLKMTYELVYETAEGLTEEELTQLQLSIDIKVTEEGEECYYETIISTVQDFLSNQNASTKKVIYEQISKEETKKQEERKEEAERQRKKIKRHMDDLEKKQFALFKEEQKWCQSLAFETNNSSIVRTSNRQKNAPVDLNAAQKEKDDQNGVLDETVQSTESDACTKTSIVESSNFLETVHLISRYAKDFKELEEIGRGGFGIVYKAQHKLDGNIYAIKKIKLSRDHAENKRTLREIQYLSGLNNQYIVRYFQTWVENETNEAIIAQFEDWPEEESSSYGSEASYEMQVTEDDSVGVRKIANRRTSSHQNRKADSRSRARAAAPDFIKKLSAAPDEEISQFYQRQRANTDQISLTPEPKQSQKKKGKKASAEETKDQYQYEDSYDDEEDLLLGHEQSEDPFYNSRIDDEESQLSPSIRDSNGNYGKSRKPGSDESGIKVLFIQMQFCEGQTLEEYLKLNPGKTNETIKWKIFRQVLEAVHYLHQRDIIHRDIKPENIFLDTNKNARLGDFGLAKRINSRQLQEIKQQEVRHEQSFDQIDSKQTICPGKNLTTGLGTLRFAAPEQYDIQGRKPNANCTYGFKADIYSLGVVLLDMFRDHDISLTELSDIHEAVRMEEVHESVKKKMPDQAVSLIEKMIKKQASQRPTLIEVLTSGDLPQDEILETLMKHLANHKSAVKLQLCQHMSRQQMPKQLSLLYHGSIREDHRRQKKANTHTQADNTPVLPPKKRQNKDNELKKKIDIKRVEDHLAQEALKTKVERSIVSDLTRLFKNNGASNFISLPIIAPLPNERTLFLSKAIRLQPWIKDLRIDPEDKDFNLHEKLCSLNGSREKDIRFLTDDYLVLDGEQPQNAADRENQEVEALEVKPLFEHGLSLAVQKSCWQELKFRTLPELLEQKSACKLLDKAGIVVGLQPQLIDAVTQVIAQNRFEPLTKMYHIGRTYVSNHYAKVSMMKDRKRLAPRGETQACFVIVSPMNDVLCSMGQSCENKDKRCEPEGDGDVLCSEVNGEVLCSKGIQCKRMQGCDKVHNKSPLRSQSQTLSEMSQYELMVEVDFVRTLDSYFRTSKLEHKYEVRLSSSELLDALLDECNVDLADRLPLLQLLYEKQAPCCQYRGSKDDANNQKGAMLQQIEKFADHGVNVAKLQELMKIRGSCDQISKQLKNTKHIQCNSRFNKVLVYFRRLEQMLSLFLIYSQFEEKKNEQVAQGRPQSQQGVSFKVRSRDKDIGASRQTNFHKKVAHVNQAYEVERSRPQLVFDFGLILEQSTVHYAGLLCCVSVKHTRKNKKPGNGGQTHDETLGFGGRFDNNVANFQQFEVNKYVPACLGMTFNCSEIAKQIMEVESKKDLAESTSTIDFAIFSHGQPLIPQKIHAMQELQKEDFRVHVDYGCTYVRDQYLDENNVRSILQVLDETGKLHLWTRFDTQHNDDVGPIFESVKQMLSEFKKKEQKNNEHGKKRSGRAVAGMIQESPQ